MRQVEGRRGSLHTLAICMCVGVYIECLQIVLTVSYMSAMCSGPSFTARPASSFGLSSPERCRSQVSPGLSYVVCSLIGPPKKPI